MILDKLSSPGSDRSAPSHDSGLQIRLALMIFQFSQGILMLPVGTSESDFRIYLVRSEGQEQAY